MRCRPAPGATVTVATTDPTADRPPPGGATQPPGGAAAGPRRPDQANGPAADRATARPPRPPGDRREPPDPSQPPTGLGKTRRPLPGIQLTLK